MLFGVFGGLCIGKYYKYNPIYWLKKIKQIFTHSYFLFCINHRYEKKTQMFESTDSLEVLY